MHRIFTDLQVFICPLCEDPVQHGLDHHHEDHEEHEVSVDVGVAVPLLGLVEAHLQAVIQLANSVAHQPLLLHQGPERLRDAGGGGARGCGPGVSLVSARPAVAGVTVLRSLLLVLNFPPTLLTPADARYPLIWRLKRNQFTLVALIWRGYLKPIQTIFTFSASRTDTMLWVRIIGVLCLVLVHTVKSLSY